MIFTIDDVYDCGECIYTTVHIFDWRVVVTLDLVAHQLSITLR